MEETLYGYSFVQKLFQVNLTQTDAAVLKHMYYVHSYNDVRFLYILAYKTLNNVINKIVTQVMTTDVYGGLYDTFSMGKDSYARINWNGVSDVFCEIMPFVLTEHFDLDNIVPSIMWDDNLKYRYTIPGKMLLHYTKWERASETPEEITRSIRALNGFSPKEAIYGPEHIG